MRIERITLLLVLVCGFAGTSALAQPAPKKADHPAPAAQAAPSVSTVSVLPVEHDFAYVCVVAERGGGDDVKVELAVNGLVIEPISGPVRGLGGAEEEECTAPSEAFVARTFGAWLNPGVNRLEAVASAGALASEPTVIEHTAESPLANSTLFILAVGIDMYENPAYRLGNAGADARAFADSLADGARGLYGNVVVETLFDADATRWQIIAKLEEIGARADSSDAFVFYYAGHGTMGWVGETHNFYLVPVDVTDMGSGLVLAKNALSASQLQRYMSGVPTRSKLVVLDACHSGAAVEAFSRHGLARGALGNVARHTTMAIFAAASPSQLAAEDNRLGHGLFTFALVGALSAPSLPPEVREIHGVISETMKRLRDLARRFGAGPQDPWTLVEGSQMPLVIR
jgi:hypothetical protein